MSLKNAQTGKLLGWKHHCGRERIKLFPRTEEMQLILFKKLMPEFKDKILRSEDGMNQLQHILAMGPKALFKMGVLTGQGWRSGYTK